MHDCKHNSPQKIASSPHNHCWVSASAGTGKTKILIDRLINLLLLNNNIDSILCVTFTKTAALEMIERLMKALKNFENMNDDELSNELRTRFDSNIEPLIPKAKSLFQSVLRSAYGLKIQTIHSFCSDFLKKISIDSHFSPFFKLLEGNDIDEILEQAKKNVLLNSEMKHLVTKGFAALFPDLSKSRFDDLTTALTLNPNLFNCIFHDSQGIEHYFDFLKRYLNFDEKKKDEHDKKLARDLEAFQKKLGSSWKSADGHEGELKSNFFLTEKNEIRKKIIPQKLRNLMNKTSGASLDAEAFAIAQSFILQNEYSNTKDLYDKTTAFLSLYNEIIKEFDLLKKKMSVFDFNDLIIKTEEALSQIPKLVEVAQIKHILIDEAQDTSLDQWEIIKKLTQSFVVPNNGTLFVVGDHKQSIYSFQGAKPNLFSSLPSFFKKILKNKNLTNSFPVFPFYEVSLNLSFRTTSTILDTVDRIFQENTDNISFPIPKELLNTSHTSFRALQPGRVCLWPLTKKLKRESAQDDAWNLAITQNNKFERIKDKTQEEQHALFLTHQIKKILDSDLILPSTKKHATSSDIMVLFQRRSAILPLLDRYLKQVGILTTGADRFILQDFLIIKDLLSLGQFLTTPFDDYNLSCLLKSFLPYKACKEHKMRESDLFELCYSRKGTVFESLHQYQDKEAQVCALSFLKESLLKSKTCSPFEFFDTLIERNLTYFLSCYGEETEDLLLEFLNILYGTQTKLGSSFKGCMNYMIATNKELKRSSFNKSMVRLMTCHASKGLQAPVVILADATVFPTLKNDLFLQAEDDQGKQILLLKSKVENDLPLTKTLKKKTLLALQQEHQRLLYVAMTRAQDQLYVTGIESAQKSWYHQIQIALTSFGITLDAELNLNLEIFPFEKEVRMNEFDLNARKNFSLFDLSTLSFSFSEPDDVSSVESAKKGSQLHLLLEYLGNTLTKDLCDLKKYCAFQKLDLIDQDIENLIQVKNKFPDLFSKNVCSEVGINCENGYRKIDRLVFFKTEIWIVDFKTHQKTRILTPYSLKKINKQLKEYKKAIGEIYPDQTIKTFVLWINDKELEEIK